MNQPGSTENALEELERYVHDNNFEGYDPYDALNSPRLRDLHNKVMRLAMTVLFRRSPVNLRGLLGVAKGRNPKAIGLFLSGYSNLVAIGTPGNREKADELFTWLAENHSQGYSGQCWGYNFPWQNRDRLLPPGIPTVVNTAYIGHAMLDYHDVTGSTEAVTIARSACEFILRDLNIMEKEHGICFSYTPLERNIVHNANVLGASLLARVFSHTGEDELREMATRSIDFTLHYQHEDGRWDYLIDPGTGRTKDQTDWHQGFILDSLIHYIEGVRPDDPRYLEAIKKGTEFYSRQFTPAGQGYWRYPHLWPVNIHNQAQGLVTFCRMEPYVKGSQEHAKTIARWTIDHLRSPQGFFYYQKHRIGTNTIPYMRWSQAWMFYALSIMVRTEGEGGSP
jgi:hypothetical protein